MASDLPLRSNLDKATFQAEFQIPGQPVVINDAAKAMPALQLWTPQWFKTHYGNQTVTVDEHTLPLAEVIDAVLDSTETAPGPYLHNCYLELNFPALIPHIQPPLIHASPNWLTGRGFPKKPAVPTGMTGLFIGGAGTGFPVLHQDTHHTNAFITQIYGAKETYLIAPGCESGLYINPEVPTWSLVDPRRPDLNQFPRFAEVTVLHHRLTAGQTLFIPAGWWHTTYMDQPAVSISHNHADALNWSTFTQSLAATQKGPRHLLLRLHLWVLGQIRALGR